MLDIITDVTNLVSSLEPGIDLESVTVLLSTNLDHYDHHHHTLLTSEEFDELPDELPGNVIISEQPLTALANLELCTNTHSWRVSKESIPYAFTNPNLGSALTEMIELTSITPADNSSDKIVEKLNDIDDLTELAIEYVEYEDSVLRNLNDCVAPDRTGQYQKVLSDEVKRIIDDLNFIRSSTLGSEKAMNLLASFAKDTYQIQRDETPVSIALGSKIFYGNDENDHEQIATALWLGLFGTDDLHSRSIETMPTWSANLLKAIHPDFVHSTLHPLGTIQDHVFDTAKKLWIESDDKIGAYSNFDDAIKAAEQLTD